MAVLSIIEPKLREATLVQAAQDGDRVAFGTLYEEYGRLVHGVLLAHVGYQDAEDLMQDVFMKALKQLPKLREPAAFPGWLIAIARRTATDYLRNSKRTVALAPGLEAGREAALEKGVAPEGAAFAILALIQRLPESYRETLVFRLVEGMTGPEIAARTGLTADSVRVNLCRGMKLLRDQLEDAKRL
jgi:RNA polymerase sigma-70 factor (ECF subfamily)